MSVRAIRPEPAPHLSVTALSLAHLDEQVPRPSPTALLAFRPVPPDVTFAAFTGHPVSGAGCHLKGVEQLQNAGLARRPSR